MEATLQTTVALLRRELSEEKHFDEELFLILFERFAGEVVERGVSENDLSDDTRMRSWVMAQFSTEAYKAAGPEEAFGLGAFWGAIGVRDACLDVFSENDKRHERRIAVNRHRELFETILRKPGIAHAELAATYGKTPSRLTQIVSEFDELDLIVTARSGRTKQYYLSEIAKNEIASTRVSTNRLSQEMLSPGFSVSSEEAGGMPIRNHSSWNPIDSPIDIRPVSVSSWNRDGTNSRVMAS